MYLKQVSQYEIVDGWQTEWPIEPNTIWWFFGYRFGKKENGKKELLLVEVWKTNNSIAYVASGHFLEKSEEAEGIFLRCIPPLPPDWEN